MHSDSYEVEPVLQDGILYSAPRSAPAGTIVALDAATRTSLWELAVYRAERNRELTCQSEPQITHLVINDAVLFVHDQELRGHRVCLKTRTVLGVDALRPRPQAHEQEVLTAVLKHVNPDADWLAIEWVRTAGPMIARQMLVGLNLAPADESLKDAFLQADRQGCCFLSPEFPWPVLTDVDEFEPSHYPGALGPVQFFRVGFAPDQTRALVHFRFYGSAALGAHGFGGFYRMERSGDGWTAGRLDWH
jgi:hypothetical protein